MASLQGMSKQDQLNVLRRVGISANEETLDVYVRKLGDLKFDHIFLINKFLETPLDTLVQGLVSKGEEDVRNYYKQVAKLLHPDKNVHPKSKEAF